MLKQTGIGLLKLMTGLYMFLCQVAEHVMHFCLQSLFRVILPPIFSWDNNAIYYEGYLKDGLYSFIWSPYEVSMSS